MAKPTSKCKKCKIPKLIIFIGIASFLSFGAWSAVRIVRSIQFNISCSAYMQRASEANTIELARENLSRAITCAEDWGLTEGIVSIFLQNPVNDMGFWYVNMVEVYQVLEELPEDVSPLEQSNVLIKLRESLRGNRDGTTSIVYPQGISVYPQNKALFWWATISVIGMLPLSIYGIIAPDKMEKAKAANNPKKK